MGENFLNRNFTSLALVIWVLAYIVSISPSEVGAAKAELAGKICTVFFWIWIVCFGAIVWFELMKYGKEQQKSPTSNPWDKWR